MKWLEKFTLVRISNYERKKLTFKNPITLHHISIPGFDENLKKTTNNYCVVKLFPYISYCLTPKLNTMLLNYSYRLRYIILFLSFLPFISSANHIPEINGEVVLSLKSETSDKLCNE